MAEGMSAAHAKDPPTRIVGGAMKSRPESTHPNAAAFPAGLSGPALRALRTAGIRTMAQLAQRSEREVAAFHGMGPKGVRILKSGLAAQGRGFRLTPPSVTPGSRR
jgi:predicted flap endonuclease-1-like 5' DNA nuclease